jgi:UDP-GlcNAc:undecaprenyl-phosphate GlcNAc-1-phosphate transferase
MSPITLAVAAALLTTAIALFLQKPAHRFGLVDKPGGRKRHRESVPLVGGIAIAASIGTLLPVIGPLSTHHHILLTASAVMLFIGVIDDWNGLSPRTKLLCQAIAALMMAHWAGVALTSLGDIFSLGPIVLGLFAIPVTVFAVLSVMNGINMFDGLNGLAGGTCLSILALLAMLAAMVGDTDALLMLTASAGAVAGFLVLNMPIPGTRSRQVFLGDAGSLLLGFVVAWFTVELSQRPTGLSVPPIVMPWVLSLVLYDLFTVTVRRALRGRNLFAPDRTHLHHLLLRRGLSEGHTVAWIVGVNSLLALMAITGWLWGVPEWLLFVAFLFTGAGYVATFLFPTRALRRAWRMR